MIVDTHFHLFKEFYSYDYIGLVRDIDRIVEKLFGEKKLDQAWVQAFPGIEQEAGDEEVLEVARRYPDVLVPFGYLDFRKPPDVVDRLKEKGAVGLKSIFPPQPYDHESLFPHYQRAEALRMPILFHTGNCGIFPPNTIAREFSLASQSTAYHRPQAMETLARTFPELRMIMGHAGCPWHMEAARIADECPHVYLDISAYPTDRDMRDIIAAGTDTGKILFGSDYPVHHPLERLYHWEVFFTHYLQISNEVQAGIFGGNAEMLMKGLTG